MLRFWKFLKFFLLKINWIWVSANILCSLPDLTFISLQSQWGIWEHAEIERAGDDQDGCPAEEGRDEDHVTTGLLWPQDPREPGTDPALRRPHKQSWHIPLRQGYSGEELLVMRVPLQGLSWKKQKREVLCLLLQGWWGSLVAAKGD